MPIIQSRLGLQDAINGCDGSELVLLVQTYHQLDSPEGQGCFTKTLVLGTVYPAAYNSDDVQVKTDPWCRGQIQYTFASEHDPYGERIELRHLNNCGIDPENLNILDQRLDQVRPVLPGTTSRQPVANELIIGDEDVCDWFESQGTWHCALFRTLCRLMRGKRSDPDFHQCLAQEIQFVKTAACVLQWAIDQHAMLNSKIDRQDALVLGIDQQLNALSCLIREIKQATRDFLLESRPYVD